ncbi:MAG: anti-sigma factor antagonist [Christensenellales bacterium]
MKIEAKKVNGALVLKLSGELDESNADFVREKSDGLIATGNIDRFIYDFTNLSFMDSTGIGVILGRYKLLKKSHIELLIKNPRPQVMKVIKTAGLNEIINII